jgi:hypothetical protein
LHGVQLLKSKMEDEEENDHSEQDEEDDTEIPLVLISQAQASKTPDMENKQIDIMNNNTNGLNGGINNSGFSSSTTSTAFGSNAAFVTTTFGASSSIGLGASADAVNGGVNNSGFSSSTTSSAFGSNAAFVATTFGASSSSEFGASTNGLNGGVNNSGFSSSTTSSAFDSNTAFGATTFGASSSSGFGASNDVSGFDSSSKNFGVVAYNSSSSSGNPATTIEQAVAELELEDEDDDDDDETEKETIGNKPKQVPSNPQSIKASNHSKKKLRKEAIVKQETVKIKENGISKNQNRPASRPESISRREPTGFLGKGSSNFIVPVVKDDLIIRPLNRDWDTGGKVRKSASSPYRVNTKISPNLSLWSTIISDIKTTDDLSTADFVTKQEGFDKSTSLIESPLRSLSLRPKSPGSPITSSPSKKNFHSAKLLSQDIENSISIKLVHKEDLVSKKSVTSSMIKDTGKSPIYSKSPKLPKKGEKNIDMKKTNYDECNNENRVEKVVDIIKPWESALAESSAKYDKTYHSIISSYSKRYKILSQKETGLSPAVISRLKIRRKEEDKLDQKGNEVLQLQDCSLSPKRPVISKSQISKKNPRSHPAVTSTMISNPIMISNSVSSDISTSSSIMSKLKIGKKSDQLHVFTVTPPDKNDAKVSGRNSSISQNMKEKNEFEVSVVINEIIEENADFINGKYDSNDIPTSLYITGKVLFPEIVPPENPTIITDNILDANNANNGGNFDSGSSIQKVSNTESDNLKANDESETIILHPVTHIS